MLVIRLHISTMKFDETSHRAAAYTSASTITILFVERASAARFKFMKFFLKFIGIVQSREMLGALAQSNHFIKSPFYRAVLYCGVIFRAQIFKSTKQCIAIRFGARTNHESNSINVLFTVHIGFVACRSFVFATNVMSRNVNTLGSTYIICPLWL